MSDAPPVPPPPSPSSLLPPLTRLRLEASGKKRRVEVEGGGRAAAPAPSAPFRLVGDDEDDEVNEAAWTTLRSLLDQELMDQWTAKDCRGVPRQCIASKDFNELWCKNPLFWFELCRRFGWSVNAQARPRVYTGGAVALEQPVRWRDPVPDLYNQVAPQVLPAREAQPLVENAAAVRDYYERHGRALLENMQKDGGRHRPALVTLFRENYRRGCQGVDETTWPSGPVGSIAMRNQPIAYNPDPKLRGPLRRPDAGPPTVAQMTFLAGGGDLARPAAPIAWGKLQELIYFTGHMWAASLPAASGLSQREFLRYKGTIDPATHLAHGYGLLVESGGHPMYDGGWADGDFDGPGRLFANTSVTRRGSWVNSSEVGFVDPFLLYEGGFKSGRYHGPGTVFGGMHPEHVLDQNLLRFTASTSSVPVRGMKVFEGTFVDGELEGDGVEYCPADRLWVRAVQTNDQSVSRKTNDVVWKELVRQNPVLYEGQWKRGKYDGEGAVETVTPDGRFGRYVGAFKEGKRHGIGTHTLPNGDVQQGVWVDDVFQG